MVLFSVCTVSSLATLHVQNKKLSCRRESVSPCFMSLDVSLSHSRSPKVIRNDTFERACVL